MAGGMERFDIGHVLSRSFGAIAQRPLPYVGLALLLAGVPQIGTVLWRLGTNPDDVTGRLGLVGLSTVASMLGAILLQIALTRMTLGQFANRPPSVAGVLASAFRLFFPVLVVSVLFALGCGFGAVLLIVPGVFLYVIWIAAVPAYIEERVGIFESFGRSRALTKGARWKVLAVSAIVWMLILGAQAPTGVLSPATGNGANVAVLLLSAVIGALGSMVMSTVQATIYAELRAAKEGIGADDLEAIFA